MARSTLPLEDRKLATIADEQIAQTPRASRHESTHRLSVISCGTSLAKSSNVTAICPNREQMVVSWHSDPRNKRTIARDVTILQDQTRPTVSDSALAAQGMW